MRQSYHKRDPPEKTQIPNPMRHLHSLFAIAICLLFCTTSVYGQNKAATQKRASMMEFADSKQFDQNLPAMVGAQTVCSGGSAAGYACDGIDLMSFLPKSMFGSSSVNDIWGWTDPVSGDEYALLGLSNGTAFVNVTDPVNPVYVGLLPAHTSNSLWRDVKVYEDHAFIVSEASNHGMQVFDLTQLGGVSSPPVTFSNTAHYSGMRSAHNIAINEDSGFAYTVGNGGGGQTCNGGLHMIDISNPTSPSFAGCFSDDGYTHDVQCVTYSGPDPDHQGKEICVASNEDTITVVDVTNKSNPIELSRTGYPSSSYVHQGWFTEDQVHFYQNDELDGGNTRTFIWDMVDLDNPVQGATLTQGTLAKDHNLYTVGETLYESNYTTGLRIFDITNRLNPVETAYFDTFTPNNGSTFNGAWSSYPYFDSSTIIVSSYQEGLFILAPSNNAPTVAITAPSNGSNFPDGSSVNFTGTATDTEDGNIASSLAWSSNLDGSLGSGASINSTLSVGTHTITAQVTDSGGQSDSDNITVTIDPPINDPPVVNITAPSDGSTFANGASINFTGTATDTEDGNIASSLAWSSNIDGSLGSGASINSTLSVGTHTITAQVTDSGGLSDNDAISVTVDPPINQPPVVNITAPANGANFAAGSSINFTGTATDPEDGNIAASLAWTSNVDGAVGTGASINTTLSVGTHTITASATDSGGLSDNDAISVTVDPPVNQPPVVNITAPANGANFAAGSSINFTGTATDPEDGNIAASLAWTSNVDGALGTGASINASLSVGTHTITASATDSGGLSDNDAISVTVDPPVNQPPVVNITAPADGSNFSLGSSINFTGTAADPEDGNIAASLAWTSSIDGAIGTGASINAILSVGSHTITASATDSGGLSDSDAISVTVDPPPNQPPGVAITAPADGSNFPAGTSINFTGSATDTEDGDISANLAWSSDLDGAIGAGASINATLSVGTHTITASATDSGGLSDSDAISVTVDPPPNQAPLVNITAPADGSNFAAGSSINFTGTASDPEDGDISAGMTWTSNLDGAIGTGASFSATLSVGTHKILAEATDSGGLSNDDTISVTVDPPVNQPPVVDITAPSDGSIFTLGSSINFTGTAVDPEDGNIAASLAWTSSIDGAIGTGASINATLSLGSHTITAQATDSGGLSDSDAISVTIDSPANQAPVVAITAPANGSNFPAGTSINFTGTANDTEDGDISASLAWSSDLDGAIGAGASVNATLSVGTHSITAQVTDSGGLSGNNAISVTVDPPVNQPPVVNVTAPADGSNFAAGSSINFTGTATDPEDGNIAASLAWTSSVDGAIGTGASFNATLSVGTHTITASATDSGGLSDSDAITVTVDPAVNQPPVVNVTAPADGSNFAAGSSINFTGTATDPEDGNIAASLAWSSDVDGAIGTGASINATLSVGTHTITASATDSGGLSDSDAISVTVDSPANEAPVVAITAPADGSSFPAGTSVNFIGTANDTEDGDISASLAWSSDLDGAIGTGASINATLSLGTHQVTASVTDSGGLTDSENVSVTITPVGGSNQLETLLASGVSSAAWTTVVTTNNYSSMVAVCTPVYSNNSVPSVVRMRNTLAGSFEIQLQNPSGSAVNAEDVHCLVVEEGQWELPDGRDLEAQKYNSTLTDENNSWGGQTQTYLNSYSNPVVLGQVMTTNDSDWSVFWSRGSSATSPPSATTLLTGKTVSEDSDVTRADETVGFVVLEAGIGSASGTLYEALLGADSVEGIDNSPAYTYGFNQSFSSAPEAAIATQSGMDGNNGGWAVLYGSTPLSSSTIGLAIDEDQVGDSERVHITEQVAYLVFEQHVDLPLSGPVLPPVVSITGPADGSSSADGDNVNFTGTANDPADGDISSNLSWSSSLDGAIGSGASVNTTGLSVGSHLITASVTNSGGLSDSDQISISVAPVGGANSIETVSVAGVSSSAWTTVNLNNSYVDMVAVCTVNYANNSSPVVVRMQNAAGSSFDISLQNPSNSSANAETVHCIAMEAGSGILPDGRSIEAQSYLSTLTDQNNSWGGQAQSYLQSYSNPVVLGQVMTYNDSDWSVFWTRGSSRSAVPSSSTLYTGKHVGEDGDVTRADETIGFIVIEDGIGSIGGVPYEASLGSDIVRGIDNGPPFSYSFTQSFSGTPQFAVATQAAMDGADGSWAVLYGSPLSSSSINLVVDEDQLGNSERRHTTEQVAFLVFASHINTSYGGAAAKMAGEELAVLGLNSDLRTEAELPKEVDLTAAYPNPFNHQLTLQYTLPEPSHVLIEVYNMLGQKVQTLVDANSSEGTKTAIWNGRHDSGASLSSGVYLVTFMAGDIVKTKSVVLER